MAWELGYYKRCHCIFLQLSQKIWEPWWHNQNWLWRRHPGWCHCMNCFTWEWPSLQCSKRTAIDMICKRRSDTCMPSQASKNAHCIIYYVMHCITGLLQTAKSDGDESSMNLAKLEQQVTDYCLPCSTGFVPQCKDIVWELYWYSELWGLF